MAKPTKSGSLYKQKGSKFWWVKYYITGQSKPVRESTKTEDEGEATAYLHRRMGDAATGKFVGLEPERILVKDLFDMLVEEYENNARASLRTLQSRLKEHLRPAFDTTRAAVMGSRQISTYISKRKKTGAENATINRELEHLKRAFKIGFDAEPQLVMRPLKVAKLKEDNVREGLLEHSAYVALRRIFPEPYQTFFVCGYHLGTRSGELRKLAWSEVNFDRKEIVLKRYNTKSQKPRVLPIYGDMAEVLKAAKNARDLFHPACPYVFQREGTQFIFDTRAWKKMVREIAPNLLFHDLRRTALTNMIEAGFSEKEAMEISGHTTDKTFRRYHIIRRHRIQALGVRMETHFKEMSEAASAGIETGIVPDVISVH